MWGAEPTRFYRATVCFSRNVPRGGFWCKKFGERANFSAGMRATTATVASISTLMEPLVATVLAWLIFYERFSAMGFVGVALLSGSLVILYIGGTGTLSRIVRAG
jgi:hypothetical protein